MPERTHYTILLYHGVHADGLGIGARNRSGKHVSRSRFEREMRWLAAHRPLVSMREIAAAHRGEEKLLHNATAVTFDDGIENNFSIAWPVLERHRIPATIYLATGYIGTGRMMWSDRLEQAILGSRSSTLRIDETTWPLGNEEERITAFLSVKAMCKALPNDGKDSVIAAVERQCKAPEGQDHPLYAFMDWDQVRQMNRSPLIDFGAHTVDHVSLTRVPRDEMRRQIDDSVARLATELEQESPFFSYPEGQESDYDDTVIDHLRQRGFDHCPSAIDGSNIVGETNPFHLRRSMVGFEGRPLPFGDYNEGKAQG